MLKKIKSTSSKVVSADQIRNEIKRELKEYVVHDGSNKTGGYYLK